MNMRISRRKALINIGMLAGVGITLPGCCWIQRITKRPSTTFKGWKRDASQWWWDRQATRVRQREDEVQSGKRPHEAVPKPYLTCGREISSKGWLGDQLKTMHLNQWGEILFVIRNSGNAPSPFCVIEMYESPFFNYGLPYAGLRLTGRKIVSLGAAERREVSLPFQPTLQKLGGIWIRCYDPMQDPGLIATDQYHRQSSGVSWEEWW